MIIKKKRKEGKERKERKEGYGVRINIYRSSSSPELNNRANRAYSSAQTVIMYAQPSWA